MKGRQRTYYVVLGVLFLAFILLQVLLTEEKVEFKESFERKEKIPYGTYALYENLDVIFPGSMIYEVKDRAYNFLLEDTTYLYAYENEKSYIIINNEFRSADFLDLEELLFFVEDGNHLFIAANYFPKELEDTLGFRMGAIEIFNEDSSKANFLNPTIEGEGGYNFNVPNLRTSFRFYNEIDSTDVEENKEESFWDSLDDDSEEEKKYPERYALSQNNQGKVNLAKFKYGAGTIILCSAPHIFTNYYFLQEPNQEFAEIALSYLPQGSDIYWDEFYKAPRLAIHNAGGPLRFVMSKEALTWAFWIAIGSCVFYVLTEIKRKQRQVPIVPPLPNTTLEFTETVGRLYYQSGDHKNLVDKKVKFWQEHVRSKYHLPTQTYTDDFMQQLAGKSGVAIGKIRALCHRIDALRIRTELTENELVEIHAQIEEFYEESGAR